MAFNSKAKIGDGAILYVGSATATSIATNEAVSNYTAVSEVVSVAVNMECGEADVTSLGSAGEREYVPAHKSGTISASLNVIPRTNFGTVTPGADVLYVFRNRQSRAWAIAVPAATAFTSDATTMNWYFLGFITGLNPTIEADQGIRADITWRISDSDLVPLST